MINSIKVRNWKIHNKTDIEFKPGTNVIIGSMGRGKSSILQAISFALFGTFSELKKRDLKISELITNNVLPEIANVELVISTSDKKQYIIKRKIDNNKGTNEATIKDTEGALLAGPNPTAVNEYISNLLGFDDDMFLRTVYAMQNEIDMLLKLSPGERKKKIDDLMNLDKFETARKNCIYLRNKINTRCQATENIIQNLNIKNLSQSIINLEKEISANKSEKDKLNNELILKKSDLALKEKDIEIIRQKFQEFQNLLEIKELLEKQLSETNKKLSGITLNQNKNEISNEINQIKSKILKLNETKANSQAELEEAQNKIRYLEKEIGSLEQRNRDLEAKISHLKAIKEEINQLQSEIGFTDLNKKVIELESKIKSYIEKKNFNKAEIENIRKHMRELELSGNICPTCRNAINKNTKDKVISDMKKEIAELLIQNKSLAENIEKLEKEFLELKHIHDKQKKNFEEIMLEENLLKEFDNNQKELNNVRSLREDVEFKLNSLKETTNKIESEILKLNDKLSIKKDEEYLYDYKERKQNIEKDLFDTNNKLNLKKINKQEVDESEREFQRLLKSVQEIKTTIKNLDELITEKNKRLSELKEKKNQYSKLKKEVEKFKKNIEFLDIFKNALLEAQNALREDLILAVNEVMSSVWLDIYPYETWSSIRLATDDNDYTLQLKRTDGDWVTVAGFASGGERMIASLAVRIAFARVLAPQLSMLILDEPTHNLDRKAIRTLIEVIQEKVTEFLDQIFIVTHEERLAESADNVIRIN